MTSRYLLIGAVLALPAFAQPAAPRVHVAATMHKSGGYLGVGVEDVDENRARALNLKEERGAEIKHVEEGSPAAKAGLKEGDVVLEYNGQRIEGVEQFIRMVGETPVGRHCRLNVWRNNANLTLTATLEGRSHRMGGDEMGWFTMPDMPEAPQPPPNLGRAPMPAMPGMPATPPFPTLPGFGWQSSMLGIESEELNPQLSEFFGVKEGVLVRSVVKNSPAEKAGLRAGDVITKIDGTVVSSPREISSLMRASRSRKSASVTLTRSKKEMTVEVKRSEQSLMFPRMEPEAAL